MISIICPTYNSEKKIGNLIKSIKFQSCQNFEVIFVDNLSQDNTENLIFESKIKDFSFYSKRDKGIYDAINFGIKKAKYKWIWILGSDDFIYNKNIVKELNKEITKIDNPKLLAIYGTVVFSSTNSRYNEEYSYDDHFNKSLCQQSIIYKKKALFKRGLFNLRYETTADYEMKLKLIKKNLKSLKYINKILAVYNDRGSSYFIKDTNFERDSFFVRIHNIGKYVKKSNLLKSFFGRHGIVLYSLTHRPGKSMKLFKNFLILILGNKAIKK